MKKRKRTPEERRESNRLTARMSRERRITYVKQLEDEIRIANDRVIEMHRNMIELQALHDTIDRQNQERIARLENDLFALRALLPE